MSPVAATGDVFTAVEVDPRLVSPIALDRETYELHAPRLMALAAALVGPSDAGDVVSGALVRVLSYPGWPSVSDPGAYLYRAVANEARSWVRSSRRRTIRELRFASASSDRTDDVGDPGLLMALSRLSLRQRAVIVLTYWADMSPAVVAAQLGISEGSVRKHLARARSTLRKELA